MSHFIKQHFLVALLHFFVFSQFHFVTLVFLLFFVSFHHVCFVLTKGPKLLTATCPFKTSAYSVHELWAFDYYFCFYIYMRTIPNLFEHYTIVLLSFTYLGLLSYLYNRRLLPLWADLVCQPVQRLLYLYTYLYYSNCNMLLTASYLISLLAHAIYLTYLVKLYVLSNVCILDFTPLSYCTSVNRAVAYGARCCIGVLWHRSGSACPAAGVCDAFVSSRMHVCVCVCVCGRRAACMRLKPDPVYCTNLNGT